MFKIKCSLGSEVHTDIARVPMIIKNTLNGKAEFIEILNEDDDMAASYGDYSSEMDKLEFVYMKNADYKSIITTVDGNVTNPCYFHIPGEKNSTISFYRGSNTVTVKKIPIETVISRMSNHDIQLNEILNDSEHLRGIKEYDNRVKCLEEDINTTKMYFDSLENIDPATVFS